MPRDTRRSAAPHAIPVTYNQKVYRLIADGWPFGIQRTIDGEPHWTFCPGVEADCDSEGLESANFERSSIFKKFTLYLEVERKELYYSHWGFPDMVVPFFTTNEGHLNNMKALLRKMTNGKGSKMILFGKPYPSFYSYGPAPKPSNVALTMGYDRVGYPPFRFI